MNEGKHTPTVYYYDHRKSARGGKMLMFSGEPKSVVADVYTRQDEVLQAVNSHDQLVEMLKEARHALCVVDENVEDQKERYCSPAFYAKVDALLKAAGEKI